MPHEESAWGDRGCRPRHTRLEGIFDTELEDAVSVTVVCVPKRRTGRPWAGVLGIRGVGQLATRIEVELEVIVTGGKRRQGMVQEVERGEAELHVLVLPDRELLDERQVAVPE